MYHTYILYSEKRDTYYVGHTGDDLSSRLGKHNSNHNGFTGKVGDWRLVYSESYPGKKEALAREFAIKRWKSRKRIEQLIAREAGSVPPD